MPRGARFQWPEIQRADRARPRQQSGLASFVAVVNLCSRVGESQRKRQELGQLREKCAPTSTAMRYRVLFFDREISKKYLALMSSLEQSPLILMICFGRHSLL